MASKSVANGSALPLSVMGTATEDGRRCNTANVGHQARHVVSRERKASVVGISTWTSAPGVGRLPRVEEHARMMNGRTAEINVATAVVVGLDRRRSVVDLREEI
jgi:hypothetical protein